MAKLNTDVSIVDYLKSQGQDSSMSARKELAKSLGISNYSGSPSQNTQMLNALKSGQTTTTNNKEEKKEEPKNDTPITTNVNPEVADSKSEESTLLGVPKDVLDVATSKYNPSDAVTQSNKNTENALGNLSILTSKDQIVSDSVWSALGSSFTVPSAVREADAWLSSQLEKIQSGKTSYSDQVKDALDKIMNREKFTYDVDTDPLFQQALASAMNSGKQAMQDTIGQASALTGGYGSTYATSAGNQAYNSFIEDAYDNLPQYYQLAMEAYQMEGDEMYRQFGILSELDDKEYNRNVTAYDATYQHRNRLYDESYTQFRDGKTDAYNMANLQIAEHGQLVSDAYNYYSAVSDYGNTLYEREYGAWADSVNQAMQYAQILNTDAWSEKNYNYKAEWDAKMFDYQKDRDAVLDSQWEKNYLLDEKLTNAQIAKMNSSGSGGSGGGGGSGSGGKTPTETQMSKALEAYNTGGTDAFNKYVNSIPDSVDKSAIVQYVANYGELPYSQRTYTVIDDGGINWGWGIDNNAKVKDEYGNEYTLKQLKEYDEDIAKELSNKKYTKGTTYKKN